MFLTRNQYDLLVENFPNWMEKHFSTFKRDWSIRGVNVNCSDDVAYIFVQMLAYSQDDVKSEEKSEVVRPNIFSHNGCITVKNPATGNHRTFQIKTVKNGPLEGKRILSILIGSDNENDYLPIGFIGKHGFSIWKKHQGKGFEKTATALLPEIQEKHNLEVYFEGKCRVCNRKLTDPDSIRLGIGPVCRGE